jgi:hypothetical protein
LIKESEVLQIILRGKYFIEPVTVGGNWYVTDFPISRVNGRLDGVYAYGTRLSCLSREAYNKRFGRGKKDTHGI